MQIIAGPHGSGKTTELIKLCAETPGAMIVCASRMRVNHVKQMAITQGYDISDPITLDELLRMRKDYIGGGNILFDDIDVILSLITPLNCFSFAGTVSDETMRFVAYGQDVAK